QSQIHPHFLYNTLQLIKAEAFLGNRKDVSDIVTSLGELLRYTLYGQERPATIGEEIRHAAHFLDITKKRFGSKFDYALEADSPLQEVRLPRLVVQPLVENCMIHGLKNIKSGGLIRISVRAEGDSAIVNVYDNGAGIPPAALDELNRELRRRH